MSVLERLSGRGSAGSKVVAIGGGEVGCELAKYLAIQGKEAVSLETLPEILNGTGPRAHVLLRLRDLGVRLTESRVMEVSGAGTQLRARQLDVPRRRRRYRGGSALIGGRGSARRSAWQRGDRAHLWPPRGMLPLVRG